MFSEHQLVDIGTETVVVCSILHTILPPWEAFSEFPTVQKYYKLIVYIIGYLALNARSTVYGHISVNNPAGPNANAATTPQQTSNRA